MIEEIINRYQCILSNNLLKPNPYYNTIKEEEKEIGEKVNELQLKLTK